VNIHQQFCPESGVPVHKCLGCNPLADLCADVRPAPVAPESVQIREAIRDLREMRA
jgi:hypothetical protein